MSGRVRALANSPIVYPLLFAAYPVVFLWSKNRGSGAAGSSALIILGIVLSLTAVVFLLFLLLFKDRARAAIATTMLALLTLTFGHIERVMGVAGGMIEDDGLLIAWILLGVASVLFARGLRAPERATKTLNLVATFLIGINLLPVVPSLAQAAPTATARWELPAGTLHPPADQPKRDVYYLIFDRYAGAQTLSNLYGYDNTPFLDALDAQGFDVVDNALANYPQTTHSLASSLNMTYLDELASAVGEDNGDWGPLYASFTNPTAIQAFRSMGYRYEHVGSWWAISWADVTADRNFLFGGVPEFGKVFLDTTLVPTVARKLGIGSVDFEHQAYDRIGFQVDSLRTISQEPEPTFTFAHFLLPHPPYVFAADGTYVPPGTDRPIEDAYVQQLQYANQVILSIVSMLQAAPGPKPIIVIQSDEGPHEPAYDGLQLFKQPWSEASDLELGRKLRILNAYYLPGLDRDPIGDRITPVNTFRVILDAYDGAELPLLPDRTFIYTDYGHPYRFEDVTDRLQP